MVDAFALETPLWELIARGTVVYLALAVALRLMPKRNSGNLSPNDMIALIIVGTLAADGMIGDANTVTDLLVIVAVVLLCDYLFNLGEYYFPRLRGIDQHAPTLLIHDGVLIKENLRGEKLTEQELAASLRQHGIEDVAQVKQAILETDGHISVIEKR